jgi:hypothetical protein
MKRNKRWRNLKKKNKFLNRLKRFGFKLKYPRDYNHYRTTSTPCSCDICSASKRIINGEKKKKYKLLKELLEETND